MTKSILVSLAILTLSTSAALAAHRTHHRHAIRPAMNASAGVGASPVVWTGGVSSSDHALYIRNLHDSRYDPKNNFNANGNVKAQ
jgi:hypothetical protein